MVVATAGTTPASLALLLDASPAGWAALQTPHATGVANIGAAAYVQQVLAFVNAYLLQTDANELAVWAVAAGRSRLLWTSPSLSAVLGRQQEAVAAGQQVEAGASAAVLSGLQDLTAQQAAADEGEQLPDAAWSACIARALCTLRKAGRGPRRGRGAEAANSLAAQRRGPPPRLLCLKAAPDSPPQYLSNMNAAFSAQRCGVVIDACVLGGGQSAFLQQAAHLTGGICLRPDRPAGLLQYLLTLFLLDASQREWLALPAGAPVDLRASCFCHRRPVDIGYACSVCLSVFCARASECTTCGTTFAPRAKAAVKRRAAEPAG